MRQSKTNGDGSTVMHEERDSKGDQIKDKRMCECSEGIGTVQDKEERQTHGQKMNEGRTC